MSANLLILVAVIYALAMAGAIAEGKPGWYVVVIATGAIYNFALAKL